ncbi:MAG: hypothetical protein R3C52_12895 [Hyphomonadaceae bacterium]
MMWEWVETAAHSSVVHWVVLIAAAAGFALRIFFTEQGLLMSDMYSDDLDT